MPQMAPCGTANCRSWGLDKNGKASAIGTYLLVSDVDPLGDLGGLLGIRGNQLATGNTGD